MEPFVEMSRSDMVSLKDVFRRNWPYGAQGYCILSIQLAHPAFIDVYNYKYYCLKSDFSHGMIRVSDKPHYYEVYISPTSTEGLDALEKALEISNIINWNREVSSASSNSDVLECLRRLRHKLGLKILEESAACQHFLDSDAKPYENMDPPENTYVGPLKPEHLNKVNETWTFCNGEESYEHFEALMKNGLTYALYTSDTHDLAAWITVDNAGAYTHLYCLDGHRRKGYAEYITKVATNARLDQGNPALAFTLKENAKPQQLFEKLGFKTIGLVWWVVITKDR